jgi:hypothetical protein
MYWGTGAHAQCRAARAALDAKEDAKFSPSKAAAFPRSFPKKEPLRRDRPRWSNSPAPARAILERERPSTAPARGQPASASDQLASGTDPDLADGPTALEMGDAMRGARCHQLAQLRKRNTALEAQNAALKSKLAAFRAAQAAGARRLFSEECAQPGPAALMLRAEQERRIAAEHAAAHAEGLRAEAEARVVELEHELARTRAGQTERLAAQLRALEMVRGSELAEAHRAGGMAGLVELADTLADSLTPSAADGCGGSPSRVYSAAAAGRDVEGHVEPPLL